jgi:hypothetical protein
MLGFKMRRLSSNSFVLAFPVKFLGINPAAFVGKQAGEREEDEIKDEDKVKDHIKGWLSWLSQLQWLSGCLGCLGYSPYQIMVIPPSPYPQS